MRRRIRLLVALALLLVLPACPVWKPGRSVAPRSIVLKINREGRRAVAYGRVESSARSCMRGQEVIIEEADGGDVVVVGSILTGPDGRFVTRLPEPRGTVRAVLERTEWCYGATSAEVGSG